MPSNKLPYTTRLATTIGVSLWILALVFAVLPVWPYIYYRLSPNASERLASTIAYTVTSKGLPINESSSAVTTPSLSLFTPLPKLDPSLPEKNGLIIYKIGVKGEINEGSDWQSILKKGIWRVPNFSTPTLTSPNRPVILAAHRWGYIDWSPAFRKLNSFINLPQLKVGDKVTIIWEQRQYEYTIYSTVTGTHVSDYNANLILYTCQLWNSPVRIFIYANRSN